jgi:hypothetical protein
MLWDKGKLYPEMHSIRCIKETADGGYFAYGWTLNGTLVAKLNSDFEIVWQQNILDGSHQKVVDRIAETDDGGIIVAAGANNNTPWIIKFNSDGVPVKQIRYHTNFNFADSRSIIKTSDGKYVICGLLHKYYGSNSSRFLIFKIDNDGRLFWPDAKLFDDESNEWAGGIIELDNGDLIAAGPNYTDSAHNGKKIMVMEIQVATIMYLI